LIECLYLNIVNLQTYDKRMYIIFHKVLSFMQLETLVNMCINEAFYGEALRWDKNRLFSE